MKTLLITGSHEPPGEVRAIVESGSTELAEVAHAADHGNTDADRVVEWDGRAVIVDERRLRWPEDEDELRLLFQTGG